MHVAVIGGGAAGLCAARHLTAPNSGFTCVVFEQTGCIGGTWVYTEDTGKDKYGLPICSAMYKNLRTNLGKENMAFPDFPFVHPKSFVTGSEMLHYLEDYTDHYDLRKHIKFFCHITHVIPLNEKWKITFIELHSGKEVVEDFDAVLVCNGHHSVPYMGHFPGISEFGGEVKHSHTYRRPEPFSNKTVLVCGGGPSGIDISYDLANFASKVYFSHRSDIKSDAFPENVQQVPSIKEVKKDHVVFEDDTKSGYIDIILICTGYKYSFPFLDPECKITVVEGKFVQPLYKQIINITYPTMGFIGLLFHSFLLPLFDFQIRFFLKTLIKEVELPKKEDMFDNIAKYIQQKEEQNIPVGKFHDIHNELRFYMNDLAELSKFEDLPPVIYSIYDTATFLRKNHLPIYRNAVFHIINDNDFEMTGLQVDKRKIAP